MKHHSIMRYPNRALSMLVVRTQTAAASTDRGAVMDEYGILIALVALTVFAFVGLFGQAVLSLFIQVEENYPSVVGNGSAR